MVCQECVEGDTTALSEDRQRLMAKILALPERLDEPLMKFLEAIATCPLSEEERRALADELFWRLYVIHPQLPEFMARRLHEQIENPNRMQALAFAYTAAAVDIVRSEDSEGSKKSKKKRA